MTLHSLSKNLIKRVQCRRCGISRVIPFTTEWTSDGLITHQILGFVPPPSIIIETEEYRDIFASLAEALGFNIDRIIKEAERKAIKVWVWDLLKTYPQLVRKSRAGSRLLIEAYMFMLCLAGLGDQEACRVAPGSHVIFYGKNLFHLVSAEGDRQGYCELLYGGRYSAKGMDLENERSVIACFASEQPAELEERLEPPTREIIRGAVEFERCIACGVPLQLADLRWDWDNGIVINTRTGLREMMVPRWTIAALYNELVKELGDEIPRLIIEAERSFATKRLNEFGLRLAHSGESSYKQDTYEKIRILLSDFPFRGMGEPVDLSLENGTLRLRVNNPYNEALICGKVLGYYESLMGRKGEIEWAVLPEEWALEINVTPA